MSFISSFTDIIHDGTDTTSILSNLLTCPSERKKSVILPKDPERTSPTRAGDKSLTYEERREEARKRLYGGVEVKNRRYRFKNYKRCFVGSEAVDFMVESGWAKTREQAVNIGRYLQKEFNLFEHVVEPERHSFDDKYLFFKFNSLDESSSNCLDDSTEISDADEWYTTTNSNGNDQRRYSITSSPMGQRRQSVTSSLIKDQRRQSITSSLMKEPKRLGLTSVGGILQRSLNQKYNFTLDKQGFYANEAVDYMVITGLANSRADAEFIGQALQRVSGVIQNASSIQEPFADAKIFFVFTSDCSSDLHERETWQEELLKAKTFFESNIKVTNHTYRLRTYAKTFTGKEAVDLLLVAGITSSRQDAVLLGRALMVEYNLFGHVCDEHEFEDSELFYKFSH